MQHPKLGSLKVVGQPITLSGAPQPAAMRPSPDLGQHTDEVMSALGFDAAEVARLRARGVV